jgi:hypothetical protein
MGLLLALVGLVVLSILAAAIPWVGLYAHYQRDSATTNTLHNIRNMRR